MVSRDGLKEELENSSFVWEEIEEVHFARVLTCMKALYNSDEPRGVAELAEELEYDHQPVRDACVWAGELGYAESGAYGHSLTEEGREELADLFE